jgi:hypothetical protein
MKSVGEAMGIGRTFAEAFWKAMQSRELDRGAITPWNGLEDVPPGVHPWFQEEIERLRREGPPRGERVFRRVDSVAGEVETRSTTFYSTVGEADEAPPTRGRPRVVILGSGPNRIGQGIEFDYCCVHAAWSFRALGYEAVMVNSNPETVSTDYDTSDRLYFEPLTAEHVLAVCDRERPDGVVVQFGGQTPLLLARALQTAGHPILGTSPASIDLAEDRERFGRLAAEPREQLFRLGLLDVEPAQVSHARDEQNGAGREDEVGDSDPERRRDADRLRDRAREHEAEREEGERAHPVPGTDARERLLRHVLLQGRLPDRAEEAEPAAAERLRRRDRWSRGTESEQREGGRDRQDEDAADEHRPRRLPTEGEQPARERAEAPAGRDQAPRCGAAERFFGDHGAERHERGDDDAEERRRPDDDHPEPRVRE